MKRYTRINGFDFREVKEIPCNTDLRGRVLTDCYKNPSCRKIQIFRFWETWKNNVNRDKYARITRMYISGYNSMRFTLVFKGYTHPDGRKFTLAVTGTNEYIQYHA